MSELLTRRIEGQPVDNIDATSNRFPAYSEAFKSPGDLAIVPTPEQIPSASPVMAQVVKSHGAWLPADAPLGMPNQDFSDRSTLRTSRIDRQGLFAARIERSALVLGAGMLTAGFAYELYSVLSFVQMTPVQVLFLIFSSLAFGWIAVGSLSAAMGFLLLYAYDSGDVLELPPSGSDLTCHTALLFPVYHEEPGRIAGTIEAMAQELVSLNQAQKFDIFILSDTRPGQDADLEARVFQELSASLKSRVSVFYRRREKNTAKKAGNIKDWVERFGAGYPSFIILDADSIMTGESLVRLACSMEAGPRIGLIQTVPRLVGGVTLFQRLQQFAAHVYGPAVATGLCAWSRHQSNYWGHNAIIRTQAFAEAAGLPDLPGPAPFGGPILSHDFVEAVLMQRRGWQIYMVPSITGSYEGCPPSLVDLIVRDRRWAQGNLQHLGLVMKRGLNKMGRTHLIMGALAYLISAVWAASLLVGLVLALQGQHVIPSYFQDSRSLFPMWPMIDPGAALRLFLVTMAVVLLPKLLGLVLELKRARRAGENFYAPRVVGGVMIETVFSALFAPILMATQTTAVFEILSGFDSGWRAQRRDENGISIREAATFHRWHAGLGITLGLLCWYADNDLAAWMAPIILGLALSIGLCWLTSRQAPSLIGYFLSSADDRHPPPILTASADRARAWTERARVLGLALPS